MAEKLWLKTGGVKTKLLQRANRFASNRMKPLEITYSVTDAEQSEIARRLDAAFKMVFEATPNSQFDT